MLSKNHTELLLVVSTICYPTYFSVHLVFSTGLHLLFLSFASSYTISIYVTKEAKSSETSGLFKTETEERLVIRMAKPNQASPLRKSNAPSLKHFCQCFSQRSVVRHNSLMPPTRSKESTQLFDGFRVRKLGISACLVGISRNRVITDEVFSTSNFLQHKLVLTPVQCQAKVFVISSQTFYHANT